MLQEIKHLPQGIEGVEAHGRVERADYEKVLLPVLEKAYREGRKVKFLYHFTPDFTGFSAGAAWDDFRVGLKYMSLLQACAVVSDSEWINKGAEVARFFMPCPVHTFKTAARDEAVAWLRASETAHSVQAKMIPEKGVLLVEPKAALTRADLDYLASIVDPWVESHGKLTGLVLHAKKFPGWENMGTMVQHVRFVRDHHREVKRIATATEGPVMDLIPKIGAHFVEAEVKGFAFSDVDAAIAWAAAAN